MIGATAGAVTGADIVDAGFFNLFAESSYFFFGFVKEMEAAYDAVYVLVREGFPYFVDNVFFGFEAIVFIGVDIILDFFAKILLLFEYRVRNEELLF